MNGHEMSSSNLGLISEVRLARDQPNSAKIQPERSTWAGCESVSRIPPGVWGILGPLVKQRCPVEAVITGTDDNNGLLLVIPFAEIVAAAEKLRQVTRSDLVNEDRLWNILTWANSDDSWVTSGVSIRSYPPNHKLWEIARHFGPQARALPKELHGSPREKRIGGLVRVVMESFMNNHVVVSQIRHVRQTWTEFVNGLSIGSRLNGTVVSVRDNDVGVAIGDSSFEATLPRESIWFNLRVQHGSNLSALKVVSKNATPGALSVVLATDQQTNMV